MEDFEVGARVAKANGMTDYLDLKFGRVNIENQSALAWTYKVREMSCFSSPKILLFRYGRVIKYGDRVMKNGTVEYLLSKEQLTTKGMFAFLEKYTQPAASIIQTPAELKTFVEGRESTITLYFKVI